MKTAIDIYNANPRLNRREHFDTVQGGLERLRELRDWKTSVRILRTDLQHQNSDGSTFPESEIARIDADKRMLIWS